MRPVLRYNSSLEQPINAIVHNSADPFRYFLKSVDSPPYIRFIVPGQTLKSLLCLFSAYEIEKKQVYYNCSFY